MAVKIRLKRVGMTKQPHYRVVAADHRRAAEGSEIETLGFFDPRRKENQVTLHAERVQYWLSKGAKPSDTAKSLLIRSGISLKQGK